MAQRLNIALIGDSGIGKSTYIERLTSATFRKEHTPTEGIDVHKLTFYSNKGNVIFNVFDCSAASDPQAIAAIDGVIVMFDVTAPSSYQSVTRWVNMARQAAPYAPIVLCGNKVDVADRKVSARKITAHITHGLLAYYDISAKSCYNFERPFVCLAKALLGINTVFTSYGDDVVSLSETTLVPDENDDDIVEVVFDDQYVNTQTPTPVLL